MLEKIEDLIGWVFDKTAPIIGLIGVIAFFLFVCSFAEYAMYHETYAKARCAKEWAAFENKYDDTCMVQIMGKWVPAKNVQFTMMGVAK